MKDRNEEIESILSSLDGLKPVSANPFLYEKIRNRIQAKHPVTQPVLKWALALSFILILNVFTWTQLKGTNSANSAANSIAIEMGLNNSVYEY
ncbi:hypothetical protein BH09BAC3_BH09BAC3_30080 [soil metagenome]